MQTTQTREEILKEVEGLNETQLLNRIRINENNMRIMKSEKSQAHHEYLQLKVQVEDNKKKLQNNKKLPYLVSNIVEILDNNDPETREDHEFDKTAIIKTSTRQTVSLHIFRNWRYF